MNKLLLFVCGMIVSLASLQGISPTERTNAYNFGASCGTDCESCCAQAYPDSPEAQGACRVGCQIESERRERAKQHRYIDEREG